MSMQGSLLGEIMVATEPEESVRILLVGPEPPPNGGIATVVRNIRTHDFPPDLQISLFNDRSVALPRNLAFRMAQRIASRLNPKGFWSLTTRHVVRAFQETLAEQRPSVVHFHASHGYSFWSSCKMAEAARRAGAKTIFHSHGSDMDVFYGGLSRVGQRLFRQGLARFDHCVVLSKSWQEWFKQFVPLDHLSALPNAINWARFQPPVSNSAQQPKVILFVGLLEARRKGVHDLLKSIPDVLNEFPSAEFHFAGADLEQVEAGLEVDDRTRASLRFLGDLTPAEVSEAYHRATVFTLPAYREGMPMVMLEAMACSLPVVCTRVNAIPEVVKDGVNGLLIEAGDREALTQALLTLLRDEKLRLRLGASASNTIRADHDLGKQAQKLEALYRRLATHTERM